ncbi:MAG: O-acetyl-ADP-ribose deacetylase [Propionibacteriaceae bacterium]|jgi:O-acetyl-ADP-ribose deacetylase (regulator of RNase III)|nr:O-acetyl-ADP-ribose deacetylase [Propionibacteriaceae bacterium]
MTQYELVTGDITTMAVDAIVNAANNTLLGGGGVDGAIHRAGGPTILAQCRQLRETIWPQGLPTGRAVATTGGRLPARWVIHTVGPVYSTREDRTPLLESCYRECLRWADELEVASIAFPTISAGAYGWPLADAAEVAVRTCRATATSVGRIVFVAYGPLAYAAYEAAGARD